VLPPVATTVGPLYVGLAVGPSKLSDAERISIFLNAWAPEKDFQWPYSTHMDK